MGQIQLQDIKAVIPPHCFQRSQIKFFQSIIWSLTIQIFIFYIGTFIPINWYWAPVWLAYIFISGTTTFGIWILGHQCGHQAFSSNKVLNHTVGYILHTILMVPYFSWRWSHHIHHNNNNHIQLGQSHVPPKKSRHSYFTKIIDFLGQYAGIYKLLVVLGPGWLTYLFTGAGGGPARGFTNHFIVPNKLFTPSKVFQVNISTAGIVGILLLVYKFSLMYSFKFVALIYLFPWVVTHSWLAVVTILQHTEKNIQWYDDRKWNWVLGAISTIDRNYPPIIDKLHHYIGTTHVLHHLFPQIPHYHAKQATQHLKKFLGKSYNEDKTPIPKALYESCKLLYINDNGDGSYSF